MKTTAKQYAQTLYELTDGKSKSEIEKSLADFARYLRKERKLKLSGKIIENFAKLYDRKNGIVEAEVVTARKLEDLKVRKVEDYIKKRYPPHRRTSGAGEVILKNTIDSNIKGGMIVRVGDEIIDGSILGRINKLRQELTR